MNFLHTRDTFRKQRPACGFIPSHAGRFGFYYGDRAAGRRPFRIFDACGDPGPDSGEVGSQNALYSNDFIWDLRFFDGFGGDPALLWGHASV